MPGLRSLLLDREQLAFQKRWELSSAALVAAFRETSGDNVDDPRFVGVARAALTVRWQTVRVLRMREPTFTTSFDLFRWIGWAQMKAGQDWVRERELSHEQSFALGFLAQHPGSIQRDIAEASRTTPASVSSLLQGLEKRGLIERRTEAGNERSKRVYATPEGIALISGFEEAMAAAGETILAPLNEGERDILHALLTKITAELPQPTRS